MRRCGIARVLASTALALALAILAAPTAAAAAETISGERIVERLRTRTPVDLHGATIRGNLDLTRLKSVHARLACTDCRIDGSIIAPGVMFADAVDLSGSEIGGVVQAARTQFLKGADFRFTRFGDDAIFAGADFGSEGKQETATFAGAVFKGQARFELETAGGEEHGAFHGKADFGRASFRSGADFRLRSFEAAAIFARADFAGRVDFGAADFAGKSVFEGARFADGASFVGATFDAPEESKRTGAIVIVFRGAQAGGDLDFTAVSLFGTVSFANLFSSARVILRDVDFPEPGQGEVRMQEIEARDLAMPVNAVERVAGEENKLHVLHLIESTAKARDELDTANDAQYRIRVLVSDDHGRFVYWLDYIFYRLIAGYLVRPYHPLLALLALALVISAFRVWTDAAAVRWLYARVRGLLARLPNAIRRPRRRFRQLAHELFDRVPAALRPVPRARPQLRHRVEVLVYRVLLALALVALARSNPTLREMLDAAR